MNDLGHVRRGLIYLVSGKWAGSLDVFEISQICHAKLAQTYRLHLMKLNVCLRLIQCAAINFRLHFDIALTSVCDSSSLTTLVPPVRHGSYSSDGTQGRGVRAKATDELNYIHRGTKTVQDP